jgi:hypothetical protein
LESLSSLGKILDLGVDSIFDNKLLGLVGLTTEKETLALDPINAHGMGLCVDEVIPKSYDWVVLVKRGKGILLGLDLSSLSSLFEQLG